MISRHRNKILLTSWAIFSNTKYAKTVIKSMDAIEYSNFLTKPWRQIQKNFDIL